MALSQQQQAVIRWALKGTTSLNLVARAGCGKSFTIRKVVLALLREVPGVEIFVGAYNKAIADEMNATMASELVDEGLSPDWKQLKISTMHSAGFAAWRYRAKDVKIEANKTSLLIDEAIVNGSEAIEERWQAHRAVICELVSLAKNHAIGFLHSIDDMSAWYDLIDHFDIEGVPGYTMRDLLDMALEIYRVGIQRNKDIIDFDDMILAPLIGKARFFGKDFVIIDEAQDINPARRALAFAMLKKGGRFMAVGDDRQAIYGFTGADAEAMENIKLAMGSEVLPLNETYRCPKKVVALANKWVPDLTALEDAPDGVVRSAKIGDVWEEFAAEDAILCRNNAPLVSLAFALIRKGVACQIEGRAIGTSLVKLCRRWSTVKTTEGLTTKLTQYLERETAKLQAKGKEAQLATIADRVDTIFALIERINAEGKTKIDDLVAEIEGMFGDNVSNMLTLCSGHKAKGREWNRVYWYGPELCPSPFARQEWQQAQEENLQYVIVTRAMQELVMIPADILKTGEDK